MVQKLRYIKSKLNVYLWFYVAIIATKAHINFFVKASLHHRLHVYWIHFLDYLLLLSSFINY